MNKSRLLKLRDMLERHHELFPQTEFDMLCWARDSWQSPTNCKTAACALGSAALYPPFKKMGLTLYDDVPMFKDSTGIDAGAEFFGITRHESEFLFDDNEYNGPIRDWGFIAKISKSKYVHGAIKPHHVITRIDFILKLREALL